MSFSLEKFSEKFMKRHEIMKFAVFAHGWKTIIWSHYAWAKMMSTKKASECVEIFKEILLEAKDPPIYVLSDKGLIFWL